MKPASREIDARIGMMVFLGSWGMVFATLFFSYSVYRFQSPVWPRVGDPVLPESARIAAWVNTLIIAASSLVLNRSLTRIDRGQGERAPLSVAFVMLCGTAFLAIQLDTWMGLWQSGVRIQDGLYIGLFYAITTFHGLHVVAGLLLWIWALPSVNRIAAAHRGDSGASSMLDTVPASGGRATADLTRARIRVRSTAMFWHFVDVAWLATFVVLYLL